MNGLKQILTDEPAIARFWKKVDKSGGPDACWLWTAAKEHSGHGALSYKNKLMQAHRVAYVLAHGSIPDGLIICHRCNVPACVNPSHLYAGTHQDNMRDAINAGTTPHLMPKSICKYGHERPPGSYKDCPTCKHIRNTSEEARQCNRRYRALGQRRPRFHKTLKTRKQTSFAF